ncbi:hypothetical protein [Escherichia coli]|nr:hypothetical protein [Escherichia coli]
MVEFDDVSFEEHADRVVLIVYWGLYSKAFEGNTKADCINQLLQWAASRK